jgi:Transketolase, pyrimidine binding domain
MTTKLTTSAMIASFADPGQKTASAPFGHALARLADQRPEIVGLSADLAKYTDMHIFRDAHPDRFFQMGMAEQVLLGAAAGMAEVGLVPFASTYSVFATRRAYDFLCLDIAEPGLNVNVVGALPGLTTGYGPSHQATEDLAILRGMPNLTIVDPCDSIDIEQAVPALAAHPGPTYLRLLRGNPLPCPTSSSPPARCPPCTTGTACPPTLWSRRYTRNTAAKRARGPPRPTSPPCDRIDGARPCWAGHRSASDEPPPTRRGPIRTSNAAATSAPVWAGVQKAWLRRRSASTATTAMPTPRLPAP